MAGLGGWFGKVRGGASAAQDGRFRDGESQGGDSQGEESQDRKFPYSLTPEQWREKLGPQACYVLREHGTERAGTSPLNNEKRNGVFACAGCGQDLFNSDTKYESGTGWPSFFKPLDGAVGTTEDHSLFMTRTEVHCSNCGGHLGHVFPDGPEPTGLRYCMNGVSLAFKPAAA
ncbi:MAG: peptide-methionine (R)-S-oxide reductase MsrB [Hyphomicrobiales bacterium]|nr:peptide-methionine (R)-S-oxide reductase MsrB [Hyphomicrobiales bacterium]